MRTFFKILMCLLPLFSWAQQNYTSGDITECHTWAPFADLYTRLKAVFIKTGTTVGVPKDVNLIDLTMYGNALLTISDTNSVTFGDSTDVKCGDVYGTDMGNGKYKYTYSNSLDCGNPTMQDYSYRDFFVFLGPMKKTTTYRWTKFDGLLYNRNVSFSSAISCWTADWNFGAALYLNGSSTPTAYTSSNIWNNRGRLYGTSICGGTSFEVYPNSWDFGDITLNAGDIIKISMTTPAKAGTSAANKTCPLNPLHYITIDIQLTEL